MFSLYKLLNRTRNLKSYRNSLLDWRNATLPCFRRNMIECVHVRYSYPIKRQIGHPFSSKQLPASNPLDSKSRSLEMSSTTNSTVAPLFEPLKLGPITLPNKIIMAAMTRSRSVPTDVPNDLNVEYYVQRAKGGAGLIVTEGALISPQK